MCMGVGGWVYVWVGIVHVFEVCLSCIGYDLFICTHIYTRAPTCTRTCTPICMLRWIIVEGGFPLNKFAEGPLSYFTFAVCVIVWSVYDCVFLCVRACVCV